MFTTARQPEALLLYLDPGHRLTACDVDEFTGLAHAAGAKVRSLIRARIKKQNPRCFVGIGKAEELRQKVECEDVRLLIVNENFSPAQERNLERFCKARVLGHSGLILDIFAKRAHSYEGKLQVELAQLTYLSTRLVRGWSHLERQKGGIGLRGPGEKQLETDRRLCRQRIKQIHKNLEKVRRRHALIRRRRAKNKVPIVALVGYTNSGKSTLFNLLTHSDTFVADMPFATLDPLMRRVRLNASDCFILSDTVGFMHDLPAALITAFRATFLEVQDASLLLHVIDASHPDYHAQVMQVEQVLKTLDIAHTPQLKVFNKIDLSQHQPAMIRDANSIPHAVFISARRRKGIDLLRQAVYERSFFPNAYFHSADSACAS